MEKPMYKQLLIALSLSAISMTASSASLFDVPTAKQCYGIYLRLVKISEMQTNTKCIEKLNTATYNTEAAALKIAEDDNYSLKYNLEHAIFALRHAQVYECIDEEHIVIAEKDLMMIKSQIK